jgi:hypothetical protein
MRILTIFSDVTTAGCGYLRCVMLFNPNPDDRLDRSEEQLRCADTVTSELMADVMAAARTRSGAMRAITNGKVDRFIEAGAWTDAALALLKLEFPQWKLRRLVNADGEWLCSLSQQPGLPVEYDEVAEGSHEILPLAILIALRQAQVLFRFLLRLVLLSAFATFGTQGYGTAFSSLMALSAFFCAIVGAMRQEAIFGPVLTHWDEAAAYAIIGRLAAAVT